MLLHKPKYFQINDPTRAEKGYLANHMGHTLLVSEEHYK
jgi:hypothetical protein